MNFTDYIIDTYEQTKSDWLLSTVKLLMGNGRTELESVLDTMIIDEAALATGGLDLTIGELVSSELNLVLESVGIYFSTNNPPDTIMSAELLRGLVNVSDAIADPYLLTILGDVDDAESALVKLLEYGNPDPISGSWGTLFMYINSIDDKLFSSLLRRCEHAQLFAEEETESNVSQIAKEPPFDGEVYAWIKDSGRVGYDLQGGLSQMGELIGELTDERLYSELAGELVTLIAYSSTPKEPIENLLDVLVDESVAARISMEASKLMQGVTWISNYSN